MGSFSIVRVIYYFPFLVNIKYFFYINLKEFLYIYNLVLLDINLYSKKKY